MFIHIKKRKIDKMKKAITYHLSIKLSVLVAFLVLTSGILYAQKLDRPPTANEVDYAPKDGEVLATNPPAFVWLPVEGVTNYILQYSQSRSFDPKKTTTVRDLDITVHVCTELFKTGKWYWRYGFNQNGDDHFGRTRTFEIPKDATPFPYIPVEQVINKIPKERPRLHFTPELVREIREDKDGRYAHITKRVIASAEEILQMNEPLFEEPRPWDEYENPIKTYNDTWPAMRPYTQRMLTSALAYLYSGDERFAAEARRRLMHFMNWDIEGSSSAMWPTELGMDIAANVPPVFDWIYPTLSEEEKKKCKEVLAARMRQINHKVHRNRPMETQPFSSHPGRMIGFVVEGSIVLAHDEPEVADWLDYTMKLLWSIYPAWGFAEGGWHEGISYWSAYMGMIFRAVAELAQYDIPLKDKPFFRNTGYFGLYAAYPKRPTRAFGDGNYGRVGMGEGNLMYNLSTLYQNPYFRWHAEVSGATSSSGRTAFLFYDPNLKMRPPTDIPQSRVFNDVGLVAMHSNMSDPENNVTMIFKSNPFGAISHNHASQNAFAIEAYGEALAISSGSRQLHGSPHHREWMWHTKAHNSILVDNEGQVIRQRSSRGKIIHYEDNGESVYTVGDATESYGDRLDRFHRHVVFLRPNYFVIIDDLKTSGKASTFQWLLHTPTEVSVDCTNHLMVNQTGNVRLTTRFLTPDDLVYQQHSGFSPQVEHPNQMVNQFHLTASTSKPATSKMFVTLMHVDRTSGAAVELPVSPSTERQELTVREIEDVGSLNHVLLDSELLMAEGGIAIRLGNDLILWKEPEARRVRAAGVVSRKPMEIREGHYTGRIKR
jgi:hypothetical protein